MKFLVSNINLNSSTIAGLPFNLVYKKTGLYNLYSENLDEIEEDNTHYGIVDGYLKNLNEKTNSKNAFKETINHWPLPEYITGSFSATAIDKYSAEIILSTDLVNLYPLYYLKINNNFYISNSLILLGIASGCEFDEAGIAQRSLGPEFSNFGSRTILKNCKRLLPGERIKFDVEGNVIESRYDNSLYQNLSSPVQNHVLYSDYWEQYKREVEYCLGNEETVNIALSGGLDSRIVLGAIPEEKHIKCLTYGHWKNYETKIASTLAKIRKADFKSYYAPNLYFPGYDILKEYTINTESVQICSWLEILEDTKLDKKEILLMGELCEGLPARNIKRYSSKKFRKKNFIKYYLFKEDYKFEDSTSTNFEEWKQKMITYYERGYSENRLAQFNFKMERSQLLEALHHDLEEIFQRIEAHNLPYAELYGELFSWYTYTRMRLAKHLLVTNSKFKAYSPAMSNRVLRNTSNLHPNLRLNYRFAKKLFKNSKELKRLHRIPTSQAPLIPQNFPDFLKFPVWGIRSAIDGYLIKRLMKHKSVKKRYRLFDSINWAMVYHNPDMEENLKSYFQRNHLGEKFFQNIFNQSVKRRELEHWPFANIDIINASSLNIELDVIKGRRT